MGAPLSLKLLSLYPKKLGSAAVGAASRWTLPEGLREPLLGRFAKAYGANLEEAGHPLREYRSFLDFFTRAALVGAGLVLIALSAGLAVLGNTATVATNLLFLLVVYVLLAHEEDNAFSLDAARKST